ncbi:M16 family metallopeptidase [Candidatus Magnetobacterium casense]|uniref:Insulinase family protein n=1 Tax=Candidatus Magnetobacterium casense TaxID=1455061 RepID=A0ABS6S1U4_9BACT|nr:pitrilysin family protein [Candidatus Magnetobacterium casensis]MBV6342368.1 insulinase family protein [Candidatus Magnetobacterium casensis]
MYRKEYLQNGIPLVMEQIAGVRSVAAGIWVKVGGRYESPDNSGISHFIEHMFFKGTKTRTQKDIAIEIDSLGGDINAFTSQESTTFYVKLLRDNITEGVEILSDIFLNSLLNDNDIAKEREIITEEINMLEDTPEDYIHDLFYEDIWGLNALGLPILGSVENVTSFKRDDLLRYIDNHYGTGNIIISCSGNIDFAQMYDLFNGTIGQLQSKGYASGEPLQRPSFTHGLNVHEKDHTEVHISIGTEGIKQDCVQRYPFLLLNTIFGSGISSRLFQEIRENRGLVYSIYSYLSSYHDTGVFGVYAASSRKKYVEVIEVVLREMAALKDTITEAELARAKNQLKGNTLLHLESSSARMHNIARQEIYYQKYYSPDEIIRGIEAITLKDVREIIDTFLGSGKKAITVLGPASKKALVGLQGV